LFALSAFAIAIHEMVAKPEDSIKGLLMVVVGLPVYFIWIALKKRNHA
jgi:hypothetical protein